MSRLHALESLPSTRVVCALALAGVTLSSCGESDEDKVRSTAELVADTDPAACESMGKELLGFFGGVDRCKKTAVASPETGRFDVERVAIKGDRAVATLGGRQVGRMTLVRRGDEWTIEGFEAAEPGNPVPKPKIRFGLSPRETVRAYYEAVVNADGAAFCGLLSARYVIELRHGFPARHPIRNCVSDAQDVNWQRASKQAQGVSVVGLRTSGRRATALTSSGKVVRLKMQRGRWVIDDIEKKS